MKFVLNFLTLVAIMFAGCCWSYIPGILNSRLCEECNDEAIQRPSQYENKATGLLHRSAVRKDGTNVSSLQTSLCQPAQSEGSSTNSDVLKSYHSTEIPHFVRDDGKKVRDDGKKVRDDARTRHEVTTLRFKKHITPDAHRLGDLLIIEHDTYNWSKLSLASHPVAGEVITKGRVLAWMHQHQDRFTAAWLGKTQTRVEQPEQTSGQALQDKAKAEVLKKLGPQYTRVDVTALSTLQGSKYKIDSFHTRLTVTFPVAKRICVWLNNDKQHIPVWFRVRAYAKVPVARRHLNSNTLILKEAFSFKERNIAGLTSPPAMSVPEHSWLKSSLEANSILTTNHIKEAPAIVHGQTVKVHYTNNHISLVMDAIALSDGNIGQTIRVKNKRNQTSLPVRITGMQQAEVIA